MSSRFSISLESQHFHPLPFQYNHIEIVPESSSSPRNKGKMGRSCYCFKFKAAADQHSPPVSSHMIGWKNKFCISSWWLRLNELTQWSDKDVPNHKLVSLTKPAAVVRRNSFRRLSLITE